jgi:hypothetical protein
VSERVRGLHSAVCRRGERGGVASAAVWRARAVARGAAVIASPRWSFAH